ncbi:MAG: flagellar filament capping protein FliD [Lachnospiraceae bacterium]|nr:flagellar filament capping protein FliD [Lachnospiraceae bacterium]MCI9623669.1 flagellar filament capping protein FliD [Lachnospiraceae bacterium]
MAISGVSGFGSNNEYQSWVDQAAADKKKLEESLGIDTSESSSTDKTSSATDKKDTSSTGSSYTSSTSRSSSTSTFLLSYKHNLTSLESASEALRVGSRNNVFSKYETAMKDLQRANTDEDKAAAQAAVDKAKEDIVTAVKDFAKAYNNAVSFLENNSDRSSTVVRQLNSLKNALTTEDAMARIGLSYDKSGNLQVDEDKLKDTLDKNYNSVKDIMGGQFGMAERAATKASDILDHASVEKIAGVAEKQSKANSISDLDDFEIFSKFALGGAYNLTNYYAVGSMLNTLV